MGDQGNGQDGQAGRDGQEVMLGPDAVQALVDAAVARALQQQEDRIRDEIAAVVEASEDRVKMAALNKAANEGNRLYLDPGTGFEFAMIALDKVDQNPLSRRQAQELDPKSIGIKQLAKDIRVRGGLLRPLLVYRKADRYMLVKGARRLVALQSMGEELVHAYILPNKPPIGVEEEWVNGY